MTRNNQQGKNDHVCPHKFAFMLDNWLRRIVQNPKRIVGEYLKAGDHVLDVGCGPGYFSIEMAKLVGESGKVIAADLQPQMLERVEKKAGKHKVQQRMEFHQCHATGIGLKKKVDFILAFYMIHETGDSKAFLAEMKQLLNPGGKILIVEPKMHVTRELFESILDEAKEAGLKVAAFPEKKGGRSVLLTV